MNASNNSYPHNEYPTEPSSARRPRTLKARIKRNMMLDSSFTSTASAPSPASGGGGFASSITSAASTPVKTMAAGGDPRVERAPADRVAVLEAASALFDLSVASPAAASFGGAAERAMAISEGGAATATGGGDAGHLSAPAAYSAVAAMMSEYSSQTDNILAESQLQHYLAIVRPPPSLASGGLSGSSSASGLLGLPDQRVQPPQTRAFGNDVPLTFPQKLMEVLSNPEIASIASWLPNGKGFIILQKRKFAADVMPSYFKHSKYTSFTRKLNRWGFTRVSRGPEMGAYYHKYFQRGNYLLCMQMHCQSLGKPSSSSPPATNKDDTEGTARGGGDEAPPSSHAADELSASLASVGAKEDSGVGEASPLSPSPAATAAWNHEESPAFHTGIGDSTSTAFSAYGTFKSHHDGTLARYHRHHQRSRLQQQHEKHHHRQHQQEHHRRWQEDESNNSASCDRVFQMQQKILRESQGHVRHRQRGGFLQQQQDGQGFRLVQGASGAHQFRRGSSAQHLPVVQSMQEQSPTLRSCMKRSHRMQPSSSQQRFDLGIPMQLSSTSSNAKFVNLGQADRFERQLGVDTSSSRNHPLIMSDALNALKTCSDKTLIAALMNKDHNGKAKIMLSQSGQRVDCGMHAAINTQLQQLKEYRQESSRQRGVNVSTTDVDNRINNNGAQDTTNIAHTLMLEEMRELQESNHKRIAKMGGNAEVFGFRRLKEVQHAKAHASDPMPHGTIIAQLYNEINARNRQQQHSGASDDSGNRSDKAVGQGHGDTKWRAVRRASAA
eukprot:CAMPEP_0181139652 /NCGR_PEP_ID=MMETSP1071-20121207/34895_1 /TAXON_ID=35127 /ORGANISM="Thalassiosira sp., Strain NH16" /LENGTH=780 /DNA_ID=CAMNT_0023226571 /DNA_START=133 /DNA_END=2475 /DNA_ORIENTATION=+